MFTIGADLKQKAVAWLALVFVLGIAWGIARPLWAATVSRVTVAATATLIYTAPNTARGAKVLIRNPSAVSVYVGSAAVTTATGFEIAAGDALGLQLYQNELIYGIVAAATEVVHVIDGRNDQ